LLIIKSRPRFTRHPCERALPFALNANPKYLKTRMICFRWLAVLKYTCRTGRSADGCNENEKAMPMCGFFLKHS